MSEPLKPMDVFSAYMDIPFDVAAYCRGHKFSQEAVNLSRAIRARQVADLGLEAAQIVVDNRREAYYLALGAMRDKMERDPL